jgi:hypothetical protein
MTSSVSTFRDVDIKLITHVIVIYLCSGISSTVATYTTNRNTEPCQLPFARFTSSVESWLTLGHQSERVRVNIIDSYSHKTVDDRDAR